MITSVEARNTNGLTQSFDIANPRTGYQVRDIEGLDPVRANIVSTSFANMDGEQYQSSRREKRNIILTIGLVPDFISASVSDLRNQLYNFFMPRSQVELKFFRSDGVPVTIQGRVESFDAPIFTQDPVASISVICFDPDFLTEKNTLNLTSKTTASLDPVPYDGTVSSGIELNFTLTRTISGFKAISQLQGDTIRTFEYDGSLLSGDVVNVSMVPGNKYITLLRGSTLSSILSGVSPYSDWISFNAGQNSFVLQVDGSPAIDYDLSYFTRHGGL